MSTTTTTSDGQRVPIIGTALPSSDSSSIRLPVRASTYQAAPAIYSVHSLSSCSAARRHNDRHSLQARLPNELWLSVWCFLPQADRIAVSHTCHLWRRTAVACPAMWNYIELSINLGRVPFCRHCNQWVCGRHMVTLSLAMLHELLARCQHAEFALECCVIGNRSGHAPVLPALIDALAPHIHRLSGFVLNSFLGDALDGFLDHFACFPALSYIHFHRHSYENRSWLLQKAVSMPRLKSMTLSFELAWPRDGTMQLTSLQSLTCFCGDANHIERVATAFPNLQVLRLHSLHSFSARCRTHGLSNALAHIDDVRLLDFTDDLAAAQQLLELFRAPRRRSLTVHGYAQPPVQVFEIMADCTHDVTLACLLWDSRLKLYVASATGRVREIVFCCSVAYPLATIWEHVAAHELVHLVVHLPYWTQLAPDVAAMPKLQTLTLVTPSCGIDDSGIPGWKRPQDAHLPALESVCVQSGDPESDLEVTVSALWLASFIEDLNLLSPLAMLELDQVELSGNEAVLYGVVSDIVYYA